VISVTILLDTRPGMFAAPILGFAVYRVIVWTGFTALPRAGSAASPAPNLLVLRVFALKGRSERLFDALSKRWLQAGPINLIAGPDLINSIVQPHEFLDFLGGRLSRRFVRDNVDLERRLWELDIVADPDGRYRVNEFFCHADTWQPTMRRLAERSDAILMDLRSFSPMNQGCLFELGALMELGVLDRVVLLVDRTTNTAFLESTLRRLSIGAARASSADGAVRETLRVFHLGRESGRDVAALTRLLFGLPSSSGRWTQTPEAAWEREPGPTITHSARSNHASARAPERRH
jgi:hypothetical protein